MAARVAAALGSLRARLGFCMESRRWGGSAYIAREETPWRAGQAEGRRGLGNEPESVAARAVRRRKMTGGTRWLAGEWRAARELGRGEALGRGEGASAARRWVEVEERGLVVGCCAAGAKEKEAGRKKKLVERKKRKEREKKRFPIYFKDLNK